MQDLTVVTIAYAVTIAGSTFGMWLSRRIYHVGHSIAWGVVDGVSYSRRERMRRFVAVWLPTTVTFIWALCATVFTLLDLAGRVEASSSTTTLWFLVYSTGVLTVFAIVSFMVNGYFLFRRVRAGKLGFVDGGQSPQQ